VVMSDSLRTILVNMNASVLQIGKWCRDD
jgi:hypothetical protein